MSLPDPLDDPGFYDHVVEKRFLAWVIDLIVTLVLVLLAGLFTVGVALFLFPLVWSAVAIAYRTVLLSRYSATLGMLVVALRLRRLDGGRPDQTLCLWHAGLHAASMVLVVPQIASVAMILLSPRRQALNDWLLGTAMVNRPMA